MTKILVTRPRLEGERTAAKLRQLGFEPVLVPVLEIAALDVIWPAKPAALVATSANAFLEATPWHDLPLYTVGDQTAEAARRAGFQNVISAQGSVTDLIALLRAQSLQPIVYLAGNPRKPDLERAFSHMIVVETYAAREVSHPPADVLSALISKDNLQILHYSRRSAEAFLKLLAQSGLTPGLLNARHICISADAAAPFHALNIPAFIAEKPDERSLFAAILR